MLDIIKQHEGKHCTEQKWVSFQLYVVGSAANKQMLIYSDRTNLQNCSLCSLALGFAMTPQVDTGVSQKESSYIAAENLQAWDWHLDCRLEGNQAEVFFYH